MKKKLIIVASPPACGKTFVSERIARSLENVVLLDKDDLSDLVRASFSAAEQLFDMDGAFSKENIRQAEYSTILNIAFSTLRFSGFVLLNAPLAKEVRNISFMKSLKERAHEMEAELVLIWVTVPVSVCYERMKKRNFDRDALKLQNWSAYVEKINYKPPFELLKSAAVDSFFVFDNKDEDAFERSLEGAIRLILGEETC